MSSVRTELVTYKTNQGDQVSLTPHTVRKYLVRGNADKVTDQEVMLFLKLCQYQRLNPFLREAYLIKYASEPATIVTGKDTFTKRAASNPACAGWEAGVVVQKQDGTIENRKGALVLPGETLIGGWAKVHRKDWNVPLEVSVRLEEYQRYTRDGELQRSWQTMPATMIRKVALVQALREAMPDEFAGMYAPEEMPVDMEDLEGEQAQTQRDQAEGGYEIEYEPEPQAQKYEVDKDRLTKDQLDAIIRMVDLHGIPYEDASKLIQARYGKDKSAKLTTDEAADFIKYLAQDTSVILRDIARIHEEAASAGA